VIKRINQPTPTQWARLEVCQRSPLRLIMVSWFHGSVAAEAHRVRATGFNRNNGLLMNLGMTILKPASRRPVKGAETLVWLATSPDVTNVSGAYFFDKKQSRRVPRHRTPSRF
jgi:hypothetical protein